MVNQGRHLATNDNADTVILAERGITFSSSAKSAVISIPVTVENSNSLLACAAFLFGSTEFSEQVTLIIIGESVTSYCYEEDFIMPLYLFFRSPSTS